ncbi:related to GTP-binding protein GTR2 [Hanseniaspora guilliermondii]|uniref:GTP-binding protein n=1 Tax=Hanseniaspora guilliermondii TaxID=56406 RepID=A0A1L0FQ39_9ASCO|nr:related to GTP-binding protein GTR2 [Hanseniaspora guilliermondii]
MSHKDYGSVKTNNKTFQESIVKNSSNGSLNSQDSAHDLEASHNDIKNNKVLQSDDLELGLRKKILLMGLDRSGKSSISKVLFNNEHQSKNKVINLGNYVNIIENLKGKLLDLKVYEVENFDMNEILQLQQLYYNNNMVSKNINSGTEDINNMDIEDAFYKDSGFSKFFDDVGTIIYVVDSTSEYLASLANLSMLIELAYKFHKASNYTSDDFNINFEVLIHKVDSLNEDFKLDTQRDIMQRIQDELLDLGIENVAINFYLTSIFDYTIYEAFSRITQKLILELPFIENLLDNFIMNCHNSIEKIFLFDINSKIYISTDSSPVNILSYEVCSEFIDVTLDLRDLYEDENPRKYKNKPLKAYSRLNNDFSIYMNEVFKNLCVVILVNNNNSNEYANNELSNTTNSNVSNKMLMTLIDYNFNVLKGTLKKILK